MASQHQLLFPWSLASHIKGTQPPSTTQPHFGFICVFSKSYFLCLYMWEDMSATKCKQRSHYNFWELGFFYHKASRDQNQVIGLSTGAFTWLSHIAHPVIFNRPILNTHLFQEDMHTFPNTRGSFQGLGFTMVVQLPGYALLKSLATLCLNLAVALTWSTHHRELGITKYFVFLTQNPFKTITWKK